MNMTMQEVVRALHEGHVPKTPLNGKPQRYSASTVKQMKECERRHFFEQVVGIELPPGPALITGTKVHGFVERYLKNGEVPPQGPSATLEARLANTGIKHLPLPGTKGMHVERSFKMASWPNGPDFTGTVDLYIEPAVEGDDIDLRDHKTTSGYARGKARGWVLTEQTLPHDVQFVSYAEYLFRQFRESAFVKGIWIYYDKSGAPSTAVKVRESRQAVRERWQEGVLPIIDDMHRQHKERPSLAQVKANEASCDNYGGCPHRAYCVDYKSHTNKEKSMGKLSDQLLAGKGTPAAAPKAEPKATKATEVAPALNPPPPAAANPFLQVKEGAEAVTKGRAAKKEEAKETPKKSAAEGAEASGGTAPAPTTASKPSAPATAAPASGFNLLVGCSIEKGSSREVVHVFELLTPLFAEVKRTYKGDWADAVRFGEDRKRASALLAEQLDSNPSLLAGKNVRAPTVGVEAEIAMSVLAPRAQLLIIKSAV